MFQVFYFVSLRKGLIGLMFFLKKKIKGVLFTEKNICTLCESKEKRINVKISTRTYDKNGEGC